MSATRNPKRASGLDAYYTPPEVAFRLIDLLSIRPGDWLLEPSAGGGAFVQAARAAGANVTAVDLDPGACGLMLADEYAVGDFLTWQPKRTYRWIAGNPPFSGAEAHVRRALAMKPISGVAFLLRLAFLETVEREAFWREHPPSDVWVFCRRPSFTGNNRTDSAAYAWFIWRTGTRPEPRIRWLWSTPEDDSTTP